MITKKTIKKVCNAIIENDNKELFNKKEKELENYWFFEYDKTLSKESNLYEFTKLLSLYKDYCMRWEEHHNGSVCVVERVRDKYLLPKISIFVLILELK